MTLDDSELRKLAAADLAAFPNLPRPASPDPLIELLSDDSPPDQHQDPPPASADSPAPPASLPLPPLPNPDPGADGPAGLPPALQSLLPSEPSTPTHEDPGSILDRSPAVPGGENPIVELSPATPDSIVGLINAADSIPEASSADDSPDDDSPSDDDPAQPPGPSAAASAILPLLPDASPIPPDDSAPTWDRTPAAEGNSPGSATAGGQSSTSAAERTLAVSFNVGPDHPLKNVVLQSMSQKLERLLQEIAKHEVDRGFSLYQANLRASFRGIH